MLKTITPDEIKEGMELAESVKNKFGQVLLAAQTKLQPKHAGILKTWGVQAIQVYSDNDSGFSQFDETAVANAKDKLSKRMNWTPRNSYEEELAQMALNRILESGD